MKIFIPGGTGFVGGHLTAELLKRGHQLVLLAHSGSGAGYRHHRTRTGGQPADAP